jgi:hypothetical protein
MKSLRISILCSIFLFAHCFASTEASGVKFKLNKVILTLGAKKWVKTQSAKLQVSINATLTNKNLVMMRADIMSKLNAIAKGDWHITQFNRSQDSSGLEKLFVQAEARVNQSLLSDVNVKAKRVTKPGAKYQVTNVDFNPSLQEMQQAKKDVREMIYQKANKEIASLNAAYPTQKYSLFELVFVSPAQLNRLKPAAYKTNKLQMMVASAPMSSSISVSNEVKENAFVVLASNRKDNS